MIKRILVPLLILIVGGAVAVSLVANRRTLEPRPIEATPITVRVVEVEPGPVRLQVHAQGTIAPRTESDLVPEVSGNVIWVSPDLVSGGYFETGEPLIRIDDRDYRASAERAEASLERSRADLELAQFEYTRARELHERDLISQADLEEKQRAVRVADAAIRDAELVLETARRDLARTELKAPFSGLVRSEQVDLGQFVTRGTAIARIYATDYLEVRLPVADQELAYLNIPLSHRGEFDPADAPAVKLTADFAGQQQVWPARLVRTEAEIDPGTRMVYAIARIDVERARSAENIAPPVGLFVEAEIDGLEVDDVVVLPRTALRNGDSVLVIDSENRVSSRHVDVLRVYRDRVFITGGLSAGERVSVSMLQSVVEGMRVQPVAANEI
jgi:RND family efflux transporter MFP subunit